MKSINDNNLKIHSAAQVVDELSIAPQKLINLASKLKCTFLIAIPDNTSLYLKGKRFTKLATSFAEAARRTTRNDQDTPLEVNPEVEFLCLEASNYNSIIQRGKLRKKEFASVALFDEKTKIMYLDPNQYAKRYITDGDVPIYIEGAFYSYLRQDATNAEKQNQFAHEKSVVIHFDDILINIEDLQAIRKELSVKEPACGKFKKGEWTSTMLGQLNEASTYFFSGESNNNDKAQLCNEIKKWLGRKWTEKRDGLLEQAANAILPDHLYKYSPPRETVNEQLRYAYNSYASTALILINEKAKKCWQEMQSSTHKKFPKRETIIDELINSKFSVKLAGATAAIIRPDSKK